jgi:hypothetical protein
MDKNKNINTERFLLGLGIVFGNYPPITGRGQ